MKTEIKKPLLNQRVLVTGGSGFLGRHVCEQLTQLGATVIIPRKRDFDFTQFEKAQICMKFYRPNIVIHSAAYYGGLGITMAEPGKIYFENLVMGANLMEAARRQNVEKFVSVGTACSYPGHCTDRLSEDQLWSGPLHDSVVAYGSVKKMLAIQGIAYKRQYDFNAIHVIPSNLYGPHDCFDEYRSHVVGALVKKFCDAHMTGKDVTVWGTGKAVREFLYVEDCAQGIVQAAMKVNDVEPVNLGTGIGTSIQELVETIAGLLSFRGKIVWDRSKPDGQKVKVLETTRMKKVLNWYPPTTLRNGIRQTLKWYLAHHYPSTQLEEEGFVPTQSQTTLPHAA